MPKKVALSSRVQNALFHIDLSTLTILGLGLVSGIVAAIVAAHVFAHFRVYKLTIGAGSPQGESYAISSALAQVLQTHYPRIHLTVKETGGTAENLELLENQTVDLATAQADIPVGKSARLITELYGDKFQLVVKQSSKIRQFSDLRGRRIALPQSGGQYKSFLNVADHFGLTPQDFQFVGSDENAANEAFLSGQADAVFRVRAASNLTMQKLARSGKNEFLPIEQSAAMQIKYPAFHPSLIPQGTYQGAPPIPSQDLPTVQVYRTLLANDRLENAVAYAIAQVLTDYRQELMDAIPPEQSAVRPLVAEFKAPVQGTGLGIPLHPGALAFYDRNKPSFIQEYADFLGLILTIVLLLSSWIIQLKRMIEARQKNQADEYTSRVIELLEQAQASVTLQELESVRQALLQMLTEAVRSLDKDLISEDSFQSFRVVWQIALDVSRERRTSLAQIAQQKRSASA